MKIILCYLIIHTQQLRDTEEENEQQRQKNILLIIVKIL